MKKARRAREVYRMEPPSTIPMAVLQGVGFLFLLQSQGVIAQLDSTALIANIALITAGSMLLMWLGELVTEFGIGNGVSLIILAGILAGVPASISQQSLPRARRTSPHISDSPRLRSR